eukprot:GFKZ01006401.1.p1 GENE.GFKZ01006401.1~~GFKZ01006401.1.p1  ORF type:complete len:104 (-),score=4.15 GFKZ01006401.1:33-344(-)
MVGGVLDHEVFQELQLPAVTFDKKKPSLGIGLTSEISIASAAFLASSAASGNPCRVTLPALLRALNSSDDAVVAYRAWLAFCSQSCAISFSELAPITHLRKRN